MILSQAPTKIENCLLAALPDAEYHHLLPHLEFVDLAQGKVLFDAEEVIEYVYFPNTALISLIAIMASGTVVEVGVVGKEGMAGLPVCWGGNTTTTQAVVQIAGTAMRMKAKQLKSEFDRGSTLQQLLLRYTQALFTHTAHTAACNRIHTIEERLARWLLMVQDRVQSNELRLTQEFISHMLGTRRSGVTEAASTLSQAGIINYSRGKITICDRKALELTACECYQTVKQEFDRLLQIDDCL